MATSTEISTPNMCADIKPEYVRMGFNSRKRPVLPGPSEDKMKAFTGILAKKNGVPVEGKTLRVMDLPGVEVAQE